MPTTTMEVSTTIHPITTLTIHQRPREKRRKTEASTHSLAAHSIMIAFHARLMSIIKLLPVRSINSATRRMELSNVIHVQNMENTVKHVTWEMDALTAVRITGLLEVFASRVFGDLINT